MIEVNIQEKNLKHYIVVVLVAKSCLTLFDPMDYSPPGSFVRGILQARILGELPFPSPGDCAYPGFETASPALAGRFFTSESLGKAKASYTNTYILAAKTVQKMKNNTKFQSIIFKYVSNSLCF